MTGRADAASWRGVCALAAALVLVSVETPAASELKLVPTVVPVVAVEAIDGTVIITDRDGRARRLAWRQGAPALEAFTRQVTKKAAWLAGPTTRYRHGALGDDVEAGRLVALDPWGREVTYDLGPDAVFEDLIVRVADLDGDGRDEMVVIKSYLDRGAALAVYRLDQGRIVAVAETAPIGRPQRWLNPAAIADLDGDGAPEVALVVTPHIGGVLELYQLDGDRFRLEQRAEGFSNHRYGSTTLDMAAVLDVDGDGVLDLALPNASRRSLRLLGFTGGRITDLGRIPQPGEITTAIIATDLDGDGTEELVYGLDDGSLMTLSP